MLDIFAPDFAIKSRKRNLINLSLGVKKPMLLFD